MWRASVLTIFPEMFPGPLGASLAGKALSRGRLVARRRRYPQFRHRQASHRRRHAGRRRPGHGDEARRARPRHRRGGGRSPPAAPAVAARGAADASRVEALAGGAGAVLVCGRFEGIDERVIAARGLEEVSIGDYVLSGGEIAAMALIDACVRLLPGVMGAAASGAEESFADGLLEYPHYTRPQLWEGRADPGSADLRRPRQNRRLAPRRGRAAHPRAPARPLGAPFSGGSGASASRDAGDAG